MNVDEINQGIRTLPEIIKGNFVDYCKICFAYIYELSYWGVAYYDIYQICCESVLRVGKRSAKVIISVIFFAFLTIVWSVIK